MMVAVSSAPWSFFTSSCSNCSIYVMFILCLVNNRSTFVRGVVAPALLTHRPKSRLGERGGTKPTGPGWSDLDRTV